MKKHMRKLIIGLCCTMVASGPVVGYAQETQEVQRIADWAVKDMHEAEAASILPNNWETTVNDVISKQQLIDILNGLMIKFETVGLSGNNHKITIDKEDSSQETVTRKEVITTYYYLMKDYNLSAIQGDTELLEYMKNAGVISGETEKELRLEDECTVQEAVLFANRVLRHVYKELDEGARGLLWEVSDEDNTVYLLGTIHIADSKNYPFHQTLNDVIKEVDKVAFEVDFYDQEGIVYLQQKQLYTGDEKLKDYIPEELYNQVIELADIYGISHNVIDVVKPWALANTFTSILSEKGTLGEQVTPVNAQLPIIDTYVYIRALLEEKEILEIEGYKFQADLLDSMALEVQIDQLSSVVSSLISINEGTEDAYAQESIDGIQVWLESFYEGDEHKFDQSYPKDEMLEAGSPLDQLLFDGRDHHMSEQVLEYLQDTENDYMVVVGAGHMIGNEGIVQQVIDAGYTVNSVE